MFEQNAPEDGFTLVELLVVILIIGVLAAIAVPAFLNQRKEAANSAVQSDLHSASVAMETELVKNNNRYPSYLPSYNPRTDGVVTTLVKSKSSPQQYCLKGFSIQNPMRVSYYDSANGGLLRDGKECGDVAAGTSFADISSDKKVLLLAAANAYTDTVKALDAYGFGEVVYNPDATVADMADYDVIAAFGRVWPLDTDKNKLVNDAYKAGYKVITDSNDMGAGHLPALYSTAQAMNTTGTLYFRPTNNSGLSPSFPYTFEAAAFANDSSWACVTGVKAGTIAVASSPLASNPSLTCITASASTNSAGGRWVHMSLAPLTGNVEETMLGAGLDWLTM